MLACLDPPSAIHFPDRVRAFCAPSFLMADLMYCFTVNSLMLIESAISIVFSPQAILRITSRSLLLNTCNWTLADLYDKQGLDGGCNADTTLYLRADSWYTGDKGQASQLFDLPRRLWRLPQHLFGRRKQRIRGLLGLKHVLKVMEQQQSGSSSIPPRLPESRAALISASMLRASMA